MNHRKGCKCYICKTEIKINNAIKEAISNFKDLVKNKINEVVKGEKTSIDKLREELLDEVDKIDT